MAKGDGHEPSIGGHRAAKGRIGVVHTLAPRADVAAIAARHGSRFLRGSPRPSTATGTEGDLIGHS